LTTPIWYWLCLDFKGVPYKTEWVEWPNIKTVYEKHGIEATSFNPDGSPRYTMPVIHAPSTGITISDSFVIAKYLDKTHPTPQIFPHHTQGLQEPFEGAFTERTRVMLPFVIPEICARRSTFLSERKCSASRSQRCFRKARPPRGMEKV
jgi:hypothetical protein